MVLNHSRGNLSNWLIDSMDSISMLFQLSYVLLQFYCTHNNVHDISYILFESCMHSSNLALQWRRISPKQDLTTLLTKSSTTCIFNKKIRSQDACMQQIWNYRFKSIKYGPDKLLLYIWSSVVLLGI